MSATSPEPACQSIPFDEFWAWLERHQNCLLRAGTGDVVLFDHEDFHWQLLSEGDGVHVIQLVRGKLLVGELVVLSGDISYVQHEPPEGEEFVFECVVEGPENREVAYHVALTHGLDDGEPTGRRWTH